MVPISKIRVGDLVAVHIGSVIPVDGIVESGEAMVNQASMTGESMPVRKERDMYVYAGTAVEEGNDPCPRQKKLPAHRVMNGSFR